jgi:hypothetical protein
MEQHEIGEGQTSLFEEQAEGYQHPKGKYKQIFTPSIDEIILEEIRKADEIAEPRARTFKRLLDILPITTTVNSIQNRFYVLSKRPDVTLRPAGGPSGYTEDEDNLIIDEVEKAKQAGFDLQALFAVLAQRMDRSPKTIENRYYALKQKNQEFPDVTNALQKLKAMRSAVKQTEKNEEKLETVKAERDEYKRLFDITRKELERLVREINAME